MNGTRSCRTSAGRSRKRCVPLHQQSLRRQTKPSRDANRTARSAFAATAALVHSWAVLHEVVCPGCGQTAWFSIETTPAVEVDVTFDFKRLADGRVKIRATASSADRVKTYWFELPWGGGGVKDDDTDRPVELAEVGGNVHECDRPGGSGDREPRM